VIDSRNPIRLENGEHKDDDTFNLSIRKFLKMSSELAAEIEQRSPRAAAVSRATRNSARYADVPGLKLSVRFDGIELD